MTFSLGRWRAPSLLVLSTMVWLPLIHHFFGLSDARLAAVGAELEARQSRAWRDGQTETAMRAVNPEWDFMSRTFAVLALANAALGPRAESAGAASPSQRDRDRLAAIDLVIAKTLREQAALGDGHFLLAYVNNGRFLDPESKSLFIDGELLMMLSAREAIEPRDDYRALERQLAARIERVLTRSPSASGESYPNECWSFCNSTALAALTLHDRLDGADHSALARRWIDYAKAHLVDPNTGLLASSYTRDGRVLDGPEGSSLWMTATNLLVVDEAFARDQYARARRELGVTFLGFGWAREWPRSSLARPDVDSGPIVPVLDASAGSSGFAVLGASAFGDRAYRDALVASLELAAFPDESGAIARPAARYVASNQVGDAVVDYALHFGPLWSWARGPDRVASREPIEVSR